MTNREILLTIFIVVIGVGAWFTGMEYQTYLTNEDRVIEEKYLKAVCASRIEYERAEAYGMGIVDIMVALGLFEKEVE